MFRSILWLSQTWFEYETFRPHLLYFRYKGTAMGRMTPRKNRSFTRKIVSSKHFFQQKKDYLHSELCLKSNFVTETYPPILTLKTKRCKSLDDC